MLMGVENGEEESLDMSSRHVIRHYCKVCNRGFVSAGALGGHMRSHVMGDVASNPLAHNGDKNKHSYYLRAKTVRSFVEGQVNDEEDDDAYRKSFSSRSFEKSEKEGPSNRDLGSTMEEDLANCLVMMSSDKCSEKMEHNSHKGKDGVELGDKGEVPFQCKACKKVFNSHQALGGHRASHKKVKGCFAAKMDNEDEENHQADCGDLVQEDQKDEYYSYSPQDLPVLAKKSRAKMHECSVCRRIFSSGQALGGHKRCHWLTTSSTADNTFIPNFQYDHHHHHHHQSQQLYKKPMITKPNHQHHDHQELDLNLNLPAPQHEHHAQRISDDHETSKTSTRLYLEQWSTSSAYLNQQEKTEKGCEVKLKKLSDLGDVNLEGGWLQMGLTSFKK